MKLGYARVSTSEKMFDLQPDALRQVGCEQVFADTAPGAQAHKLGQEQRLAYARPGDTVVIWRLDQIGHAAKHRIDVMDGSNRRQLYLISLQAPIDTPSPGGRLVFQIFCALAPRYQKIAPAAKDLYEAGHQSTRQLLECFGIGSRRMRYKTLRFAGCQINATSSLDAGPVADYAQPLGSICIKPSTKAN